MGVERIGWREGDGGEGWDGGGRGEEGVVPDAGEVKECSKGEHFVLSILTR